MDTERQAAWVDAAAALIGLPIAPYRDGVLRYFALACAMNAIVEGFAVDPREGPGGPIVPPSS